MDKINEPLVRIVDDEQTIRNSEIFIFKLIGLESVAYESAEEFLEKEKGVRPGCIVADLRMGQASGLEMMIRMKERNIDLPIVFLTGHGTVDSAVFALKQGAYDFLQKPVKPEKLQQIVKDMIALNKEQRAKKEQMQKKRDLYNGLTDREKQVLRCVANDLMNKQIACDLSIAEHTVKIHRANALRKLGIRTSIETHDFLKELGLLNEDKAC